MTTLTGALARRPRHTGGRSVVPRGSGTPLVAVAVLVALASVALVLLVSAGGGGRLAARPVAGSRPVEASPDHPEHPARAELGARPPGLRSAGAVDRRHAPAVRPLLAVLVAAVGAIAARSTAVGRAHTVAPARPWVGRPSSRGPPAS